MEAAVVGLIGADRHERPAEGTGHHNGRALDDRAVKKTAVRPAKGTIRFSRIDHGG